MVLCNYNYFQGAIGHLLGAAGAVEAIFAVLAIHHVSNCGCLTPWKIDVKTLNPLYEFLIDSTELFGDLTMRRACLAGLLEHELIMKHDNF